MGIHTYTHIHIIHSPFPPLLMALLPIANMRPNQPRRLLRAMLPPNRLDKVPLRIHQVEVNTMIDQIIFSFLLPISLASPPSPSTQHTSQQKRQTYLNPSRRTKIHPIRLTHIPHLLPCPRQSHQIRMKLPQIRL